MLDVVATTMCNLGNENDLARFAPQVIEVVNMSMEVEIHERNGQEALSPVLLRDMSVLVERGWRQSLSMPRSNSMSMAMMPEIRGMRGICDVQHCWNATVFC